ncbi:MAG: iron ABC transporter permease, partial [Firmicutes bacterium]|nr:iron ABC transporter permease [Bacillota bacterium]
MTGEQPVTQLEAYASYVKRKQIVFALSVIATIAVALFAVSAGSMRIPLPEVIQTLFGKGEPQSQTIIWNIRLTRVMAAILVGGALSVSGAVMQCVLQNPLASASTLGVSQGAAFGAALGIIVFGGGVVQSDSAAAAVAVNNPYIVTLCAFACGSLSTLVIILLAQFKRDLGPGGLILAGVALSSLFSGGTALLQYFADETKIATVVFWTFGNLGAAGWKVLSILALVFLIAVVYFMLNRWNYNAMESGADTAKSLGVNTRMVMLAGMGIGTLTAAVAVSFVGIISFVGLVAPHIMRRFVGNDYRYLIPCSAAA